MEGVTILSTTTVTILGVPWGVAIFLALATFAMIFLLLSLKTVKKPIEYFYAAIVAVLVTAIALIPVWISIGGATEVTEYKVIIDDSVKYNEFIEKYEVIDQEDEIYTVRERTD